MTSVGIDSVRLTLNGYQIDKDADLEIDQGRYNNRTGKLLNEFPLFNEVRGAKAQLNNKDLGIRFTIRPFQSVPVAIVEFSVGRVADGSNYGPPDFEKTVSAFDKTEEWLGENGIDTNLMTAGISRLDSVRNIEIEEAQPKMYFPTLSICQMTRTKMTDYNGEGLLWKNKSQQICAYDKLEEMKIKKHSSSGLPPTLRIEHRCLNSSKVKSVFGFRSVSELLKPNGFKLVPEKYIQNVGSTIFKYTASEIEGLSMKSLQTDLRQFKNMFGAKHFYNAYHKLKGLERILETIDADLYLELLEGEIEGKGETKKRRIRRLRNDFAKTRLNIELTKTDMFRGRTSADLYNEIREKTLAKVS